jgi:hypothetical protein
MLSPQESPQYSIKIVTGVQCGPNANSEMEEAHWRRIAKQAAKINPTNKTYAMN